MKNFTQRPRLRELKTALMLTSFILFSNLINSQTVLVPFSGSVAVPCGSNVALQDHAGGAAYSANANGFVVLDAGALASINISGTYTTEAGWDFIRIYNGVGIGGTLLQTYAGQNLSFNFQGAPGQTLTLRFSSDGSVQYAGFDLNVTYSGACSASPCAGAPASNTVVGPSVLICPNTGPNPLYLVNPYVSGNSPATATVQTGYTYAWYTTTTSAVGPFVNAVTGATNSVYSAPATSVTTYYQAVITCTNGGVFTTTATSGAVMIAATTTSVVPYVEGFEGIGYPNKLPNCSWWAPNLGSTFQTYTTSASNNRIPRNGTSFAAFGLNSIDNYVYTNGIQMEPGITYSAALHYATEYLGNTNWTSLSILIGPNQSTTGLVHVETTAPAVSGPYKLLSDTFNVPASGIYYMAIRANGVSGGAPYLMIDDISITIPCLPGNRNTPVVAAAASGSVFCENDLINLTASGADIYSWNTGDLASSFTPSTVSIGNNTFVVVGTNTLTGCTDIASVVFNVKPSPAVSVFANNPVVCSGQPVNISAFGAASYQWSNNNTGPFITVTPTVNSSYTVVGTNSLGCTGTAVQQVSVMALPNVSIGSAAPGEICPGEAVTLTGSGAQTYQWSWNIFSSQQAAITEYPQVATTYTLIGTAANGCSNKSVFTQNVGVCSGIQNHVMGLNSYMVYPNPASNNFVISGVGNAPVLINVMDLSGRILFTKDNFEMNSQIDISGLANGIYYVQIGNAGNTQTIKLIKE